MNKITYFIGAAAMMLTLSACEDWLDLPSESKADSSSVFETVSRAEMTVMGAYTYLHTQELGYQILMGTDECASTESNSKYQVSNYDYTATSTMLSGTYTAMYKAIEFSNVCIKNIPNMTASTAKEQTQINMLLGESLAIRAYAYWCLVRFYGDIPYTDTPTADKDSFASSRVSRDTIYDHCVADLQRAIELLPWKSEGYVSTPERFTKNSAYGILARVALQAAGYSLRWDLSHTPYDKSTVRNAQRDDKARIKELYQIAANACKAVIDKGENGLIDDYDQLFRNLANQTYNKETMLEYGWYSENVPDVRTGYVNGTTTSGTSSTLGKGGSQMMVMPTFYFEFEEGDQRRDVSICNYGLKFGTTDAYQMNTYAGMCLGKYRINWKKERGSSDSRRDINWPLLRYPDVLLMYAEALNELNNGATAEAVAAVKQVRMRAFKNNAAKVGTIPTAYQDFKDFIIHERMLELNNEGLRKSDLLRWGILYEHLTANKQQLIDLCNHEGKYKDVAQYWGYKQSSLPAPTLNDPTIALDHIELTEADVAQFLTAAQLTTLHTLNSSSKGSVTATFYEDKNGNVVSYKDAVSGATAVKYTILNMWSVCTIKQKGNLSVEEVKEGTTTVAANNSWITGETGVYYGLKKDMVEIMPFNTTSIIDVNPGLADQQHPCY